MKYGSCKDENYEKPSKHKQWNEKSGRSTAPTQMTKEEIKELIVALARSNKCNITDITTEFEKIHDPFDEDRDDCLLLRCFVNFTSETTLELTKREVFSHKIIVPDHVKTAAEERMKQVPRLQNTTQNTPTFVRPVLRHNK